MLQVRRVRIDPSLAENLGILGTLGLGHPERLRREALTLKSRTVGNAERKRG